MRKIYLIVSFTLLISGCKQFNSSHESNNFKIQSNTDLDKSINLNKGIYYCKKCNLKLYNSYDKFNSNDNNESFDKSNEDNVEFDTDYRINANKTELKCKQCGIKLGNVWNDGPKESTGNRHCVNKNALIFKSLNYSK
ncbi:MAG: peptide-methionine (R)-S-oxide reductase [Bacteroidetes bacterium]|jgi:peptide methionine sulfoxide reductase MsrB|nr:peptide-methionine (R)-S-oxide reductase [Bacteroidota bacterium]MDA1019005.1 peptide-methionine (R)-S-oxide reductase [Bacteroidota bacterium]